MGHEDQKGNPKIKSRSTELAGFFEMNQMAHAIYDEYLRKNASNKIACSEIILKEIKDKLSEVHPYIFDDLIMEVREQIAKEFLPSFSLSSHSKKGKQLLDWYQTYNEFPESIKIAVQSKLNLNSTDNMILPDIPLTAAASYNSKSLSSSKIIPGPNAKLLNPVTFDQAAKEFKLRPDDQGRSREIKIEPKLKAEERGDVEKNAEDKITGPLLKEKSEDKITDPLLKKEKKSTESKSPLSSKKNSVHSKSPLSSEIIPKETMITSTKANANGYETQPLEMPDINFNITGKSTNVEYKSKDDIELRPKEDKSKIQRPQSAYPTKKEEYEDRKTDVESDIIEDDEIY